MVTFSTTQFNRLFPFYILMDRRHQIQSVGSSLAKLYPMAVGGFFTEKFSLVRPGVDQSGFDPEQLRDLVVIIRYTADVQLILRGHFELLDDSEGSILFIGTPWFESMEQIIQRHLTIKDFATHDPMIDMLHILKNQEIATDEVTQLLGRVNEQKEALKKDKSELKRKENMLEAISWATGELLSNTDFFDAVSNCLIILGNTIGVDKIYFFQNHTVDAHIFSSKRLVWRSITQEHADDRQLENIPLSMLGGLLEKLQGNEPVSFQTRMFPVGSTWRVLGEQQRIESALMLPVFLRREFWGFIAFADGMLDRLWQDSELALLKSFVNSVANALERAEASREMFGMALFALENPDPMIRVGVDGKVLLRNEAARQLEHFVVDGRPLLDHEFFEHLVSNIPGKGTAYTLEGLAGSKVYQVVARMSETGEHINIYANDITEEKRADTLLKESNERLSTLIVNLQAGVLLEDETRHIVLTNKMFCSMFGIDSPPEALKGLDCSNASDASKHLFSDPDKFVRDIARILAERKPVIGDQIALADGRTFERSYVPIIVSDHHRGHLWKYVDVTSQKNYERNLKKQEEKYRGIIENMNLGLIEVDLNGMICYANDTMCMLSGYSLGELLMRKAVDFFAGNENREILASKLELRKRGVADTYEMAFRNKQGELRWWLTSGTPNYSETGEVIGSIGIHLDITEHKRAEEELRIAKLRAEESSKAKENFLANMSHEIRTPLNAIIGMVRELRQTSLSQHQSTYLDHAGSASQHLLSIVNNILDISKIEAGELHLEHQTFSLRAVLAETEAIMLPAAQEKLIDLRFNVSAELGEAFKGDPSRIRQILLNIVSNAVKFTEKGSVLLSCDIIGKALDKQEVMITITDTGIGMDSTYLDSLFKKFSQEDVSTARRYGGSGLGMAITRELLQLMSGTIAVTSEKGRGTQFRIVLPLTLADPGELAQLSKKDTVSSLTGKRILLVEDNELNRLVAVNSLSRFGMLVAEAEDGLQALKILEKEKFDLILMDLQMPVLGGLEATGRIRDQLKLVIPIIALTANAFKTEIDKCFSAGMNDYVTKPFEEKSLIQAIQRNLGFAPAASAPMVGSERTIAAGEKLYDLSQLQNLSRGDQEFLDKIIRSFCKNATLSLAEMHTHFESGNWEELQRIAHRTKPGIDNMGIASLRGDIRFLESIPSGTSSEDVQRCLEKVDRVVTTVIEDLLAHAI